MKILEALDGRAVQVVAKLAPWLAPLPTAWLVMDRTGRHLGWPLPVAILAGLTVETLGLAVLATALALYSYNRERRKVDPPAPLWMALVLAVLYWFAAEFLTVLLDIVPNAARFAAAVFPCLSIAATSVLAIRADHQRRLAEITEDKRKRAKAHTGTRPKATKAADSEPQEEPKVEELPEFATKAAHIRHLMETEPALTQAEIVRATGYSASHVSDVWQKQQAKWKEGATVLPISRIQRG